MHILNKGSSSEIISALRTTFSRSGIPRKLLSDNGTPFVSAEFENFLQNLGVQHVYSSNYHPISNGCIERFHSTLKSRLNRIFYGQNISLHAAIDKVLFDIRSTPNSMTGDTPFFRFFSRRMRTKLSLLSQSEVSTSPRNAVKEYRNKFRGRLVSYQPNDLVYYRKGAGQLFSGKAKILDVVGKNAYEILTDNNLVRVYNQCDLKPRCDQSHDCPDYQLANEQYDSISREQMDTTPFENSITTPPKRYNLRRNRRSMFVYKD